MNIKPIKFASIGLGMLVGGLIWVNLPNVTLGKTAKLKPPKLKVESTPLSREVKLATSFAGVVKQVAAGVVYITSNKAPEERPRTMSPFPRGNRLFPFFDEPQAPSYQAPPVIGSGVIVSADGYILTNNHVVADSEDIVVTLLDKTTTFPAKLVGADPHTDIAVLKIDSDDVLPALILSDSSTLEIGDVVLALGNPFGVGQTVTMGIVSATGRGGFGIINVGDFIQTDASINPGNSGGALVDAEGRLVGINTLIMSGSGGNQGIGFAVPINMARGVMDQIIEFGNVERGLLGIEMQAHDEALARHFGVEVGQGVLVGDVAPGGPAAEAGIEAGDIILEFDGQNVEGMHGLKLFVAETRPGTEVDFLVLREGKKRMLKVTVGRLPEEGYTAFKVERDYRPGAIEHDALDGVTVADLTNSAREEFRIPRSIRGALITRVEPGSAADLADLTRGDVIVSIEQQIVENADDAVGLSESINKPSVLLRVWSRGVGGRFVVVNKTKKRRR